LIAIISSSNFHSQNPWSIPSYLNLILLHFLPIISSSYSDYDNFKFISFWILPSEIHFQSNRLSHYLIYLIPLLILSYHQFSILLKILSTSLLTWSLMIHLFKFLTWSFFMSLTVFDFSHSV
jgi:hypothetical protein